MTKKEALAILSDMAHGRAIRMGVEDVTHISPDYGLHTTTHISTGVQVSGGWVFGVDLHGSFERALADLARQLPHEVPA